MTADAAEAPAPRVYYAYAPAWGDLCRALADLDRISGLGFDSLLISPPFASGLEDAVFRPVDHDRSVFADEPSTDAVLSRLAAAAGDLGLRLLIDLDLQRFDAQHPLAQSHPDAFALHRRSAEDGAVDPRRPGPPQGVALARLSDPASAGMILDFFSARTERWFGHGLAGLRLVGLDSAPPDFWRDAITRFRAQRPDILIIADTPGLPRPAVQALAGCGVDHIISSSAWWNGRDRWLAEEHEALRTVAPLLGQPEAPYAPRLAARLRGETDLRAAYGRALMVATAVGAGLIVPMGFEHGDRAPLSRRTPVGHGPLDLTDEVRAANMLAAELGAFDGEMRLLSGAASEVSALLRVTAPDVRHAEAGLLALINTRLDAESEVRPSDFIGGADAAFAPFQRLDGKGEPYAPLGPGEVRLLGAGRAQPIRQQPRGGRQAAKTAARQPRLRVEQVSPAVDGGALPVKRVIGDRVAVTADIYADGHEVLAAELRWRAVDESEWRATPMAPAENDVWSGAFPLERLGRHQFQIEAWLDRFGSYRRDLGKKWEAGVAQAVDFEEGRRLIVDAAKRTEGEAQAQLSEIAASLKGAEPAAAAERLLAAETRDLMAAADDRPFAQRSETQCLDAERRSAQFASWYELFPRSQTDDPARHGTFDDVIARLPDIREMGFDVLYFPPIHPIGAKHRKGRNNSLTPEAGDPGSPYAIGSPDGGHDAIHPELGDFEDFRRLVAAARDHGLEIALDFAIQCSPDHPWVKAHPGWFDWRPDGTIKYAENPPKKYQDIVNVDFYKDEAIPDLWIALRDVVLLWVREGVRTFRVDNPHTKPFAFWEWMIREVRLAYPDVIFLSEAFTRPKVMYRLAKIGFSQSYTYFTWRHSKAEFIEYLTELTQGPPKDFFRPHFFVNTPDINPYFLQTSGRAGFLIRAALAATLSGLWGVYSGFELLESEPVPGKEEYKDSEKYEIRVRDWNAPGSIVPEITQLNRLRKGHPALQTHLNVRFLPASDDNILFYAKPSPDGRDMVLVAVNLDPHAGHGADVELPFWLLGISDHGEARIEDLLSGQAFIAHGKWRRIDLDPGRPYAIWRMEAAQ
ncbi:MAG: DUF3416 domain-containing protein [Phenylobacterium sp.]|uniref:maltotransferase domain-containing protein n=1 Tax=Phenylobacterium sp. TaxID=1871053 RepID=UPI0017C251D3|nr:maltotransferase domain-containing protein [Phenylobacterium sp.]MBA4792675.1 DUF3416 domain-containing protein [Phenylobacterium sp.]